MVALEAIAPRSPERKTEPYNHVTTRVIFGLRIVTSPGTLTTVPATPGTARSIHTPHIAKMDWERTVVRRLHRLLVE